MCNPLQLAAVRGKIYAIGGWDDNHEYLDTVEVDKAAAQTESMAVDDAGGDGDVAM